MIQTADSDIASHVSSNASVRSPATKNQLLLSWGKPEVCEQQCNHSWYLASFPKQTFWFRFSCSGFMIWICRHVPTEPDAETLLSATGLFRSCQNKRSAFRAVRVCSFCSVKCWSSVRIGLCDAVDDFVILFLEKRGNRDELWR